MTATQERTRSGGENDQSELLVAPEFDALYVELGDEVVGHLIAEGVFHIRGNGRRAQSLAALRGTR